MTECWWPRGCRRWGEGARSLQEQLGRGAVLLGSLPERTEGGLLPAPSRLGLAAQDSLQAGAGGAAWPVQPAREEGRGRRPLPSRLGRGWTPLSPPR